MTGCTFRRFASALLLVWSATACNRSAAENEQKPPAASKTVEPSALRDLLSAGDLDALAVSLSELAAPPVALGTADETCAKAQHALGAARAGEAMTRVATLTPSRAQEVFAEWSASAKRGKQPLADLDAESELGRDGRELAAALTDLSEALGQLTEAMTASDAIAARGAANRIHNAMANTEATIRRLELECAAP